LLWCSFVTLTLTSDLKLAWKLHVTWATMTSILA